MSLWVYRPLEFPGSPENGENEIENKYIFRTVNDASKSCYHFSTMSDQYVRLEGAQRCVKILQLSDESI